MYQIYNLFPGIFISVIIYFFSLILGACFPTLGAGSFAILGGLIAGNIFFKNKKFEAGTKFCESKLLEYSVVLLGASVTFRTILDLGIKGVSFVLINMSCTLTFAYFISKKFGFSKKFSLLMGAGNAICGSSAILSSSKVLNSSSEENGLAVTMVNITGTLLMFFIPLVVIPIFFPGDVMKNSALIGGVLQSVGQVVGSAAMINENVVKYAAIFKIFRILMLTFVLILFSHLKNTHLSNENLNEKNNKKFTISIPWYIKGFFIICIFSTFSLIPQNLLGYLKNIGKILETIALSAIGLRVKYSTLKQNGASSFFSATIIGAFQTLLALILIKLSIF